MKRISRRRFLKGAAGLAAGAGILGKAPLVLGEAKQAVKMGALIPLTGIETIFGKSMLDSTRVAVDEINEAGGVLGRKIDLIVEDTETRPDRAVAKANKLMEQDKVAIIVGTLTSAERNAVVAVTSKKKMILINPTYYEGGLCSKYFFSTGALPNQQFDDFIPWIVQSYGPSFYLVGSDYAWPRGSFKYVKEIVPKHNGKVIGEEYVPFGTSDFSAVIRRIGAAGPNTLFPLVAGTDGVTFVKQAFDFGLKDKLKICSSGFTELSVAGLSPEAAEGVVSFSDYFMVLDNPQNKEFLKKYRAKAGADALVDLFGENMYNNVHLFARAAAKAKKIETEALVKALKGLTFDAPSGKVVIDPNNHHAVLNVYIARVGKNRTFEIVKTVPSVPPKWDCGKLT